MHNEVFADSFSPRPVQVLGLWLANYTIAHELALIQRRNPLIFHLPSGFAELPLTERGRALAEAVLICCRRNPRLWRLWVWLNRRRDLVAEARAFYHYRATSLQDLPTVKMPRTPGVPYHYFGSPALALLINYLSRHHQPLMDSHYKGSPLNVPLGLARILHTAHLEAEGSVWVENHHDVDAKQRRDLYEQLHPAGTFAYGEEAVQKMAEEWNAAHPDSPVPLPRKPAVNPNPPIV